MSTTPIVQFGTSRFLQAHADFFVSEAEQTNSALGGITVVQSSGSSLRSNRLTALSAPEGFPVHIRGVESGVLVDDVRQVTSVKRALSTQTDWEEITRIVVEEAEIILSNTSDAGFKPTPFDGEASFHQGMSFPAKLTHLLWARFKTNKRPIQVMPTELIVANGDVLRSLVLPIAKDLSEEFCDWVGANVTFVNSLVDRIVSEPLEPAGAVAEPYALWAIQDCPGLVLPCLHPAVQVVPSLEPIENRKLFILNLGHTYLVARWLEHDRQGAEYVRDMMNNPEFLADLKSLYEQEVIPGFEAAGMKDEASAYVQDVLDRFANPFLEHRLADIAQNHQEKLQRRIGAFVNWSREHGCCVSMPKLNAVMNELENAS